LTLTLIFANIKLRVIFDFANKKKGDKMAKFLPSRGVEIKLGKTMVCELTGRIMEADETIIVSPKFKRIFVLSFIMPRGLFFVYLTIVPFRPKKDVALYLRKKKVMGLLTNVRIL
jgi:hypothetical protein